VKEITLSKASLRYNRTHYLAIEIDRIVHRFHTEHNPRNSFLGEAHSDEDILEILLINSVISLVDV
jgi:hypothetical protein